MKRNGGTPLFRADCNDSTMVAALLDAGASAGARAKDGSTALMEAIRHNNTSDRKRAIEELLRRSSPETRRAVNSHKPFESWQLQVIVELRESGATVKRANAAAIKVEDDQQEAAGGSRVRAREEAQGDDPNGRLVKRPAVVVAGGERQDEDADDDVVVPADEGAEDQQEREKRRELAERLKELEEEFLARAREIKTEMHEL
jgi:hypothetical protein